MWGIRVSVDSAKWEISRILVGSSTRISSNSLADSTGIKSYRVASFIARARVLVSVVSRIRRRSGFRGGRVLSAFNV